MLFLQSSLYIYIYIYIYEIYILNSIILFFLQSSLPIYNFVFSTCSMISVIMQILEGDLVTSLVGLCKLLNMTDF